MDNAAVNDVLVEGITKLDSSLIPPGFQGDDRAVKALYVNISKLIDAIGAMSAAAQGLNRVLTTARKMADSNSLLYLLKDPSAKNGQGEVIGLLKVGYKHLFLFDERNAVVECEPLCVLDFFVLKDRQRSGYGRVLFDYMLNDMEVTAHQLAIDGPSPKMEKFMVKNYNITGLIRQNNNFAVAAQFFGKAEENTSNKSGRSTPAASAAVGRFAAAKPHSAIANVIHGGSSYYPDNGNQDVSEREAARDDERDYDRDDEQDDEEDYPTGLSDDDYLPEPLPWAPPCEDEYNPPNWDDDDDYPPQPQLARASSERPSTLPVETEGAAGPPDAPAQFADMPAAGLPSGNNTPAAGAAPGARRDAQLTDKGYFDVKFYHNRLW